MLKKIKLTTITALSLFLFLVLLPGTAGATNATRVNARLEALEDISGTEEIQGGTQILLLNLETRG